MLETPALLILGRNQGPFGPVERFDREVEVRSIEANCSYQSHSRHCSD